MAKKKNVKVDIEIDKVDIHVEKTEDSKEFKLDSEKLDVQVKQDAKGTEVIVESESGFLKKVGNFISKVFVKRFSKEK